MKLMTRVNGKEGEGNQNLGPMAAKVFLENVEDLVHESCLLRSAGHGQEDGAKRKGAKLHVPDTRKKAVDVGAGALFVEARVDKTNQRTGSFGMEPGCGKQRRNGQSRISNHLNFPEARGERGHFLGEKEFAGFEIANMAREAFDFGEVVRRNEYRVFGGALEKTFDELIANERIESAERLI